MSHRTARRDRSLLHVYRVWSPNALVQPQARYKHCDEVASEKRLSAATFVRLTVRDTAML